jgi:uncharacterized membrane protein
MKALKLALYVISAFFFSMAILQFGDGERNYAFVSIFLSLVTFIGGKRIR